MDWDKLRIFQAAADAGSFTHAGETLGLSQSAVSRQVGSLEADLGAPLFHRHARGRLLTEQGEILLSAVHDVVLKLDAVRSRLIDSREKPTGELSVTTTLGSAPIGWRRGSASSSNSIPEVKLQLLFLTTNSTSACARRTLRSDCASRASPTSFAGDCSPCTFTPMLHPIT